MGVRSLAPGRWLTADDREALAAKHQVLRDHRSEAVAALDATPSLDAAVRELRDVVAADIGAPSTRGDTAGQADRPDRTEPGVPGGLLDRGGPGDMGGAGGAGDVAVPAGGSGIEALVEAAARHVAEDLCLLVPADGTWVLAGGCVCFPSHWRLADKLGQPLAAVHRPVPHYADELAARVDRFLDRLAPGRGAWRRNWLVHTDDRLFAPVPPPAPDPPLVGEDAGHRLWLRSERQTLRRLPTSGAVVFTIRTQQAPLAVVAARPELRARMAAAVASWSDALVAYRGGEVVRGPLLAWLRADGARGA